MLHFPNSEDEEEKSPLYLMVWQGSRFMLRVFIRWPRFCFGEAPSRSTGFSKFFLLCSRSTPKREKHLIVSRRAVQLCFDIAPKCKFFKYFERKFFQVELCVLSDKQIEWRRCVFKIKLIAKVDSKLFYSSAWRQGQRRRSERKRVCNLRRKEILRKFGY